MGLEVLTEVFHGTGVPPASSIVVGADGLDGFQTGLINLEGFEAVPPGLGLVLQGAC